MASDPGVGAHHLVPEPVEHREPRGSNVYATLGGQPFDRLEAPRELRVRLVECQRGVNPRLPAQVHDGEQQVA